MSRLTVKGNIVSQKDINKLLEPSNKNQFGMNDAYYKLKEYEDLEEQGLLLKLPCKVGDKIYNIEDGYIFECDAKSIDVRKENGEYIFCIDYEDFKLDDFNKTVFLTKEEAEQELKRLESAE